MAVFPDMPVTQKLMGYLRDGSETGKPDVGSMEQCGSREAWAGGRTQSLWTLSFLSYWKLLTTVRIVVHVQYAHSLGHAACYLGHLDCL